MKSILDWKPNKPPVRRGYLNGFMLYHMVGHLWLGGKVCPWPEK